LTTQAGTPFPYRDLILFVTFGVIVVTLIGQGLLLPGVVRWLGLASHVADERELDLEEASIARKKKGRSGTSTVGFGEGVGSFFIPSAGTPNAVN
jgi:NhaP-type Na+/H+ or K+/H+ antiporter